MIKNSYKETIRKLTWMVAIQLHPYNFYTGEIYWNFTNINDTEYYRSVFDTH